jgi:hypothetical protein
MGGGGDAGLDSGLDAGPDDGRPTPEGGPA